MSVGLISLLLLCALIGHCQQEASRGDKTLDPVPWLAKNLLSLELDDASSARYLIQLYFLG
mgnify:CR=1 FL=1